MAETIPVTLVTQEQYDEELKHRLLQTAFAQGTLYTLMLEIKGGDDWPAAKTTVEFENILKVGLDGVPAATFLHLSLFRDRDYRTVARIAGVMRDDFVILDTSLDLIPPHSGSLKRGFVLPHDDGVDRTSLVASEALELTSRAQ